MTDVTQAGFDFPRRNETALNIGPSEDFGCIMDQVLPGLEVSSPKNAM